MTGTRSLHQQRVPSITCDFIITFSYDKRMGNGWVHLSRYPNHHPNTPDVFHPDNQDSFDNAANQ
jgi:hypothetical protein